MGFTRCGRYAGIYRRLQSYDDYLTSATYFLLRLFLDLTSVTLKRDESTAAHWNTANFR